MIKVRSHRRFNFILLKITVPLVEINLQKIDHSVQLLNNNPTTAFNLMKISFC